MGEDNKAESLFLGSDIKEHKVKRPPSDYFQRVPAVDYGDCFISFFLKNPGHNPPHGGVIINYHDRSLFLTAHI